jgi:thiol-disulfide isomerase/thioredoxin
MKHIGTTVSIILLALGARAQISIQSLLKHSKSYYSSLQGFSLDIETRFKNAIIIDTVFRKETFCINNTENIKFIKNKEMGFLRVNNDEYNIYLNTNSFDQFKGKRQSIYRQEYSEFPFTETNSFFFKMDQLLFKQPKLIETDSTYSLFTPTQTVEFRKIDYSIKRMKEVIYDKLNKGYQYKELFFSPVRQFGPSDEKEISHMLQIVKDSSRLNHYTKQENPQSINREILLKKLEHSINNSGLDISNKTVLLDFFYQGCYPCVKSYPYLNQLNKNKPDDLIVLGVDQLLGDAATIDKYIEKYNIQYPVVAGEDAVYLSEYFKLNSFPVFIIIAPDGKIVHYEFGFGKSSFKKLLKQFDHTNGK